MGQDSQSLGGGTGQREVGDSCLAQELPWGRLELHQVATGSPDSFEPVCPWLPPQVSSGQPSFHCV